jgi:uncharacterized PurR-regulated membrane protein YhhQ (DUF165 family)
MIFAGLYVAAIALVNWGFAHVPLIHGWPPLSIAVGGVFALRDFGQRAIGHKILIAMAAGLVLSYVLASPFVAIASAVAFAVSEGLEWLIYTITKRPFRDRVAWSVLGSTPIDSSLFLLLIGAFSPFAVVAMTVSKFVGAAFVYGGLVKLTR